MKTLDQTSAKRVLNNIEAKINKVIENLPETLRDYSVRRETSDERDTIYIETDYVFPSFFIADLVKIVNPYDRKYQTIYYGFSSTVDGKPYINISARLK